MMLFFRIRAQPTVRRAQNARYLIKSSIQTLTTTAGVRQDHNSHTPDSYSKEVDHTPPTDDKIHRVDPDSDLVQKPYEAPSGEWSRAGVRTDEYRNTEGGEGGVGLTGNKGTETSKSGGRPDAKARHGRG